MKIKDYADKKDIYTIKSNLDYDGIGSVADPETNNELVIAFKIHRDVFSKTAYLCNEDAPELLHACVCSMFELIYEMPIIQTVLLTPSMIWEKLCEPEDNVTEEIRRFSTMALCGLREAFTGYLSERQKG